MKKLTTYILFLILIVSCKKDNTIPSTNLTMGSGYNNDIYYSLANGVVSTVPRTNWDIAFNTNIFSATILTNGGAGIKLYTYPGGDTSVWKNTLSTSGINTWPVMYNADTSWTWGAFQRNTVFSNPFDYGWGIYDYSNTHDIIGDSLFIIQLQDQTYRKLWMKRKASLKNTFIFEYANLDGSSSKLDSVNCNSYLTKNFVYYSIAQEKIIDREPISTAWDFVATQYMATSGKTTPTAVPGILTSWIFNLNPTTQPPTFTTTGTLAAEVSGANANSTSYTSATFSSDISTIGWSWAGYNQASNTYSVQPQQVYFLKTSTDIYKLVFTSFAGSGTGVVQFDQTKVK